MLAPYLFFLSPLHKQVFEKRESPAAISSSNEDRAFVVGINARGRRALLEARRLPARLLDTRTSKLLPLLWHFKHLTSSSASIL